MQAKLSIKNIKGQTKTIELDQINLITGKNGTGKSAILESLIVALDGEHPTAGKTLGAVCSMISGDVGEIELDATRGDAHINILRIFKCAHGNSQKIYINGREEQQATARSMIDEFLGGASARKISPYKFINLSPKERLTVLAEMLPGDKLLDIQQITQRTLYSGSEEVLGISRYTKGTSVAELSDEEFVEVVQKARLVDAQYLDLADRYIVVNQYGDAAAYAEALITKNKEDVNEVQSEVNRIGKSLQSHQDTLGDISLQDGPRLESLEVLHIQRSETDQKIADIERDLAKTAHAVSTISNIEDGIKKIRQAHPDLDAEIRRTKKGIAALNKACCVDENFDHHAAHMEISQLTQKIAASKSAAAGLPSIIKDREVAEEQLVKYKDVSTRLGDEAKKLSAELSGLEELSSQAQSHIDMLGEDDACPLCGSEINVKKLIKSLAETKDSLDSKIDRKRSELSNASKSALEASREEKSIALLIKDYDKAIENSNKLIFPDSEILASQKRIDALNGMLEEHRKHLALQGLESDLATLVARKENIQSLMAQAKKIISTPTYSDGDLEACQKERDRIDEMIEKAIQIDAIKKLAAAEQIALEDLKTKRSMLKKIGGLLLEVKKESYWFIDEVAKIVESVMGEEGVINNSMFGVTKDGVQIQDKVLSGGERLLFIASVLLGFAHLSDPGTAKIIEIEGSELDGNNLEKLVSLIKKYPEVDMAIITSHINLEVADINNIRT